MSELFEFILPDLGEGVREAEIRAWHVATGERVEEHQNVVEVETDKAVVDIPAPCAGIVRSLGGTVGDRVAVGEVLLTIESESATGQPAEDRSGAAPVAAPRQNQGIVGVLPEAPAAPASVASPTQPAASAPRPERSILALPGVRALAREKGVAIETLAGSGPGGRITEADVLAAAAGTARAAGAGPGKGQRRIPFVGLRRSIAEHLLEAQRRTVFVTSMAEVDVTALRDLKRQATARLAARDIQLTFLPFFMKATQHALAGFPVLNARLDEEAGEIEFFAACHLGIAIDTREGLMVPVVRHVETKSVLELATELQQLETAAKERSLPREQLQGSTFTLTNFGGVGGCFATPVINYPNVAILGFGGIAEKPWVADGRIAIRHILPLSLTFDHRVLDGAEATRFLMRVGELLEDPGLLFIESV